MKILYHHRTASKDGQNVHITEIVAALRALGHEVVVVGPEQTERVGFGGEAQGLARLRRLLPRPVAELMELGYSVLAYRRLAAACRREKPDVLYERHNLFLLAGLWLKRRYRLPLILEVNAPLAHERGIHGTLSWRRLAAWTEALVWRGADRVLPVTAELARMVMAAGVPAERILVTPNGIDPRHFHPDVDAAAMRRDLDLDGRLVVGFTGFLREWHGLERVVDALADAPELRDAAFVVVGDGPARAGLEAHGRRRGVLDRMRLLGVVPRQRVPACVAAFDIALQPAVVAYASPLKLFEYMALGKAIVAPDQPNIREVLSDGVDALLFAPGSDDAFRAALVRLAGDADLRRLLGAAAAAAVERRQFTWTGNARRIAAVAQELRGSELPRAGAEAVA